MISLALVLTALSVMAASRSIAAHAPRELVTARA